MDTAEEANLYSLEGRIREVRDVYDRVLEEDFPPTAFSQMIDEDTEDFVPRASSILGAPPTGGQNYSSMAEEIRQEINDFSSFESSEHYVDELVDLARNPVVQETGLRNEAPEGPKARAFEEIITYADLNNTVERPFRQHVEIEPDERLRNDIKDRMSGFRRLGIDQLYKNGYIGISEKREKGDKYLNHSIYIPKPLVEKRDYKKQPEENLGGL